MNIPTAATKFLQTFDDGTCKPACCGALKRKTDIHWQSGKCIDCYARQLVKSTIDELATRAEASVKQTTKPLATACADFIAAGIVEDAKARRNALARVVSHAMKLANGDEIEAAVRALEVEREEREEDERESAHYD